MVMHSFEAASEPHNSASGHLSSLSSSALFVGIPVIFHCGKSTYERLLDSILRVVIGGFVQISAPTLQFHMSSLFQLMIDDRCYQDINFVDGPQ